MRNLRAVKLVALSMSIILVSITGLLLGLIQAQIHGLGFAASIPALESAVARASLIAHTLSKCLRFLGLADFWAAALSLGLGIFLNNALVAGIMALSPFLILKAKPFSDKYLAKIYHRYRVWLFKPIGWTTYRILSVILPLYGLALQCYLIGGIVLIRGFDLAGAEFLPLEAASITAICITATMPALSDNPGEALPKYLEAVKKLLPAVLSILFAAALLEANAILNMRYIV